MLPPHHLFYRRQPSLHVIHEFVYLMFSLQWALANQNDCQLLKTGARRLDCVTTADLRVRGGNCFQSSVYSSPTYRKNEEKESRHSASLECLRNRGNGHARVLRQLYVKGKFHKQFLKFHVRFLLFIDVLGPFIPSLLRPICMPAIGILMKS